ncbi:MAG TPA: glucoamylase family protein, partial [Longimicrobiales bacterium]
DDVRAGILLLTQQQETMRHRFAFIVLLMFTTACTSTMAPQSSIPAADAAFLDTLQQRTFRFFWERANPANGLVPDRWPTPSFSSVAAIGFGLAAYPVGIERGFITRAQAVERTLTTLRFLWRAPQGPEPAGVIGHNGLFYHFLDMNTGHRFERVELSTIDTGLLMAGVLFVREYYNGSDASESEIRSLADSLYRRVNWQSMVNDPRRLSMGWHPETGFIKSDWHGYDESMVLHILALGSPTHPIDPSIWTNYTSTNKWGTFYNYAHIGFAPLVGHQYSHIFIDFRGIQDTYIKQYGIDYFENSRRATLAQRAYAIDNPNKWAGYGADVWGLTAADGPIDRELPYNNQNRRFWTYSARGASHTEVRDDGTLAPTAAGGSIAFAPEFAIRALRTMRDRYGAGLWGEYGFLDSFNPSFTFTDVKTQHGKVIPGLGWFDGDYLGIDQGPIVLMVENYRSELIWKHLKKSPYIIRGLQRAGFTGGWLSSVSTN